MAGNSNYFIQGATALSPAMQDVMRGNQAYYDRNLASLNEQFQLEQVQSVARMGAQRLAQYGPEGEQWAQALEADPYGAYAMAEALGGFGAIEGRLANARAQGALAEAIGQMQQAGASPQEIVGFILRTQGPEEGKLWADALGVGQSVGPAEYETTEGVFIRDPSAPGGYRNVGMAPERSPLVQIGDSGLKPEQAIAAEDRSASRIDSRVAPLEASMDAYEAFLAVYEMIKARDGKPTLAESDTLAKLASRVETGEAVNEGDITRKSGGGVYNALRAQAGIGILMSPETMEEVAQTTASVAEARRKKLAEIRQSAKEVASERGLNPEAAAPSGRLGSRASSSVPIGTIRILQDPDTGVWGE
ncbi:MAG: hypothetical protein RIS45_68, partial [Planctomycetota bacterium]